MKKKKNPNSEWLRKDRLFLSPINKTWVLRSPRKTQQFYKTWDGDFLLVILPFLTGGSPTCSKWLLSLRMSVFQLARRGKKSMLSEIYTWHCCLYFCLYFMGQSLVIWPLLFYWRLGNAVIILGSHKPWYLLETRDKRGYWEKISTLCHCVCDLVTFTHDILILYLLQSDKHRADVRMWGAISPWFVGHFTYLIYNVLNIQTSSVFLSLIESTKYFVHPIIYQTLSMKGTRLIKYGLCT